MEYSQIEVSVTTNALGMRESETYRWAGRSPYILVSWDLISGMDEIGTITFGPYKLRKVKDKFELNCILYINTSYPFWRLIELFYRASRWADLVYRRLIITLAVWGLADYHQYCIPSWRDVKLFKKVKHDEA